MAVDSVFIPRPVDELLPPELDELGAATADSEPAVPDVGLESAPASDSDVVGAVVLVEVFAGATAVELVEL
jgi:hypothetical protein